jgi:hypothetical protein
MMSVDPAKGFPVNAFNLLIKLSFCVSEMKF